MRTKRAPQKPPQSLRLLLLETRARKAMTQAAVVKRLGCTATTYKAWEKGQKPRAEWFVAIADLCGISLGEVVGLVTAESP